MATLERRPETLSAERIVAFRLGSERYGIDIFRVVEIVRPLSATRLPHAQEHFSGVIDLRGRNIPVLDLGCRLGLGASDSSPKSRIVIVDAESGPVGLSVDEVYEVMPLDPARTEPPPVFAGEGRRFIRGVAKQGDRLIVLLDLDELLAR